MSISKKRYQAPEIPSRIDFTGFENKIILVEGEEDVLLQLKNLFSDGSFIFFTPRIEEVSVVADEIESRNGKAYAAEVHKIFQARNFMAKLEGVDFYIIHRIDLMDLDVCKKMKGSLTKSNVSLMHPRCLKNATLILTSCTHEHMLRGLADKTINLKLPPCH
jgi:hypothetical protein